MSTVCILFLVSAGIVEIVKLSMSSMTRQEVMYSGKDNTEIITKWDNAIINKYKNIYQDKI